MPVYRLGAQQPALAPDTWIAPSATVIGAVELGSEVSVWFGAVIRADNEKIRIGRESNVQESAVLHVDPGFPMTIGDRVTIGHQAMLHGCTIGDESLVGIQAVILNGAVIGRHCLVGAGALVTEGKTFPEGSLIIGAPAKVARPLTEAEIEGLRRSAANYVQKGRLYAADLGPAG